MKRILSVFLISVILVLMCCSGCALNDGKSTGAFNEIKVPSYYTAYLDAKIKQINYNEEKNEISERFIFITDLHWDYNEKRSPVLVKYVRANTDVDKVVFGGDYISIDYETGKKSLGIMSSCFKSFGLENYYAILGNHDTNTNNGGDTEFIPYGESMGAIYGNKQSNAYYRVDSTEFCFLFLNTNDFEEGNGQYNWLYGQLTGMEEDKSVVIFMHDYYMSYGEPLKIHANPRGYALEQLLEKNSADIKCTVAAIFSGHIHHDYLSYNKFGCPAVATTCDGIYVRAGNDEYYREKGTITEQAFDVVQIDKTNRKIFLTRIGAGSDRSFKY